jgi:hypothetical protein
MQNHLTPNGKQQQRFDLNFGLKEAQNLFSIKVIMH